MGTQETRRIPSPENRNIIFADPKELMKQNPAALIVNKESYARMVAHFDPAVFDPPQVVNVETYSASQGKVNKRFVVDGLTRVKYANDNIGNEIPGHPDFKFDQLPVRDVTASYLKNPSIVKEDIEGRDHLTMAEYLHAVVPPTAIHSEIATDRIAAHLINGWQNIVGEKLADRFSAVAALSFASNSTINERVFQEYINSQEKLLSNETSDERERLNSGLIEMMAVIRESKLRPQQVTSAALALVSAESATIGGSQEAQRQVWGLLYTPEVQRKLQAAFPEKGDQEQARSKIGELITRSLNETSSIQSKQRSAETYQQSLEDKDLSLTQVLRVLTSATPVAEYSAVREDISEQRITAEYMRAEKRSHLTEFEERVIRSIGRKRNLNPVDITSITKAVQHASRLSENISQNIQNLSESYDDLIRQGVSHELIEDARSRSMIAYSTLLKDISSQQGIEVSTTYQALARSTKEAEARLDSAKQKISVTISKNKIGSIVDSIYGEEIREGYGIQARDMTINYIHMSSGSFHEETVREIAKQLQSLDPELQLDVMRGTRRLSHALRLQEERNAPKIIEDIPTKKNIPPAIENTRAQNIVRDSTHSPKPAINATTITSIPEITQPAPVELPTPTTTSLESQNFFNRRKEINNQRLTRFAREARVTLRDVDLSKEEMASETREELMTLFNEMGSLLFGHPNSARVITEYQQSLQQELKDEEDRVKSQLKANLEDSRTQQ